MSKSSKTIEKTLDPSWEEDFEFVTKGSLKKVIKDGLQLEIKDKDQVTPPAGTPPHGSHPCRDPALRL